MKNLIATSLFFLISLGISGSVSAQSLKRANEAYEQFNFNRAIELYRGILKKDVKNAEAYEKMADCYAKTNNIPKAAYAYGKAVRYNPTKHYLKLEYGHALMKNEKYDDALMAFESYEKTTPKDSRTQHFIDACRNIEQYKIDESDYRIEKMTINSKVSDISPVLYNGGIVFASERPQGQFDKQSASSDRSFMDMFFTKEKNGRWTTPEPLEGKSSFAAHEGPATFNQYSNVMYFTRNTKRKKAKKTGESHLKIYQATWQNNKWENTTELPFCNDLYSVAHPALAPDGKTLYFTSERPGASNKDLYVTVYENEKWSTPKKMSNEINTEGDEIFPTVHDDGTLYFASNGRGGLGGLDIFSAKKMENGSWKVENVGVPINSSQDDFSLSFNKDKTRGYFSSNRKGGHGDDDIYTVSVTSEKARELLAVPQALAIKNGSATLDIKQTSMNVKAPATASAVNFIPTPSKKAAPATTPTPVPATSPEPEVKTATLPNSSVRPSKEDMKLRSDMFRKDLKLVLIGIVLDKISKEAISNALVQLEDMSTHQVQEFYTKQDGNFYFKLEPERIYKLSKIDGQSGVVEDDKSISTIDEGDSKILHAVLEGTANERSRADMLAESIINRPTDTFRTYEHPPVAFGNLSETYENDTKSDLTFKLQIGAFDKPLTQSSHFFKKITGNINTEKTPNGLTRYVTGHFESYEAAEKYRQELVKLNIDDAFVAGYLNNNRIESSIEEILELFYKK
ncbi:MAG: tetratricopeptide repeat protein [Chitinophagales bacterium]